MSTKELIAAIMRAKYAAKGTAQVVIVTEADFTQLDREHAIVRWKENHPGALIRHESLCGLSVMGHDWMLNDGETFAVVDNDEFLERYWRPYGKTDR